MSFKKGQRTPSTKRLIKIFNWAPVGKSQIFLRALSKSSGRCLLLGVKRTSVGQSSMSAYDPKRTLSGLFRRDPSGRAVPDALKGYRALCNAMTPAKSMHAIKRPMTDVIESVHDVVPTHKNLPRERPF